MAWKPRKRRGSAACQDKAPKGETLSYLRVSVRHVWQKLDCLKPSSKACIATQRRKESCKAVSDCQGIWCYCILKTAYPSHPQSSGLNERTGRLTMSLSPTDFVVSEESVQTIG